MSEYPRIVDVSALPRHAFGHRSVTWWATVAFMGIEGTTILIGLFSYYFIRGNFIEWPPSPTALPDLLIPTISMLVLLAVIIPMHRARAAALRLDVDGTRTALVIGTIASLAAAVLRGWELAVLNTRWDESGYGSVLWLVLGLHSSLLLVDVFETGTITAIFFSKRLLPKHLMDVEDAGLYQWFLSLIWIPCYYTLYLLPRWG